MGATMVAAPRIHASLRWSGGMAFEGEGMGGERLHLDQPPEAGGAGTGFKPIQVVLHALGACMAMTVVSILAKQRVRPELYRLEVTGEQMDDWPHGYTRIVVEHIFRGEGLNQANLERLVALAHEKYCSVAATLRPGLVENRVVIEGGAD